MFYLSVMSAKRSTGHPSVAQEPVTATELMQLPDDGNRYELVRGELVTMAPAGFLHGVIGDRIGRRIGDYVEHHALGISAAAETGFQIERDADTVRAPDYAFISHERLAGSPPAAGYADVIPDLVVEVLSPRDRQPEVDAKTTMWLDAGIRLVWVVDPASRTVVAHHERGTVTTYAAADTLIGEPVLPGFTCPVTDILAD